MISASSMPTRFLAAAIVSLCFLPAYADPLPSDDHLLKRPQTEEICRAMLEHALEAPARALSGEAIVQEELRLQGMYEFFRRHLGRDSNLFETRRMRQVIKVRQALRMMNSQQIANRFHFLFKDTLRAFYLTQRNALFLDSLRDLRDGLTARNLATRANRLRKVNDAMVIVGESKIEGLEQAISSKNAAAVQASLDRAIEDVRAGTLKHGKILAKKFDEYSAAYGYLQKLAFGAESEPGKRVAKTLLYPPEEDIDFVGLNCDKLKCFGEGATRGLPEGAAELASDTLRRLQPGFLLGSYFKDLGLKDPPPFPHLSEFYAVINRFPEIEMHRMKILLRREAADFVLALGIHRLVLDAAIAGLKKLNWSPLSRASREQIENVLAKMPEELKDRQKLSFLKLRAAWRSAHDARAFYFDIENIAYSLGTDADKLRAMLSRNASTDDAFMLMFARRVDLRESWLAMKNEALRQEENFEIKPVYSRMLAAEELAKGLGDLSLESYSMEVNVVRWSVEWLSGLTAAAVGSYTIGHYLFDGLSDEEIDELKPKTPTTSDRAPYDPSSPTSEYPRDSKDDTAPWIDDPWGEDPFKPDPFGKPADSVVYPGSPWSRFSRDPSSVKAGPALTPAQVRDVEAFLDAVVEGLAVLSERHGLESQAKPARK